MAEVNNPTAPPGTKDHDPAPPCLDCGSERYWSDYWTEDFIAICVPCVGRRAGLPKESKDSGT